MTNLNLGTILLLNTLVDITENTKTDVIETAIYHYAKIRIPPETFKTLMDYILSNKFDGTK